MFTVFWTVSLELGIQREKQNWTYILLCVLWVRCNDWFAKQDSIFFCDFVILT